VDGEVQPDLVPMLEALERPDRELAMRLVTPEGIARVTVVRRGRLCVLARRIGVEVAVRVVGPGTELRNVAMALVAELPAAKPAAIEPVTAPLDDLSRCLSGTHDALELADRIRALGVESQAAMLLGTALGSRQAFAEIVHYALADEAGRISRGAAAVGVFYTRRGRIVGAPSASPTGELWTALKPGSDHAVAQAITQLVELSDERWATFDTD
jgi:EspG family